MTQRAQSNWLTLSPPFPKRGRARSIFRKHAEFLADNAGHETTDPEKAQSALEDELSRATDLEQFASLRAALHVLSDIALQHWSIRVTKRRLVQVRRPDSDRLDPHDEKARIRDQELVKRDEQLRQPSGREFVNAMERGTAFEGQIVSIFTLMRDGRELANSLRSLREVDAEDRVDALREVIDPYLQFVDKSAVCTHTGLRLQDIWRYFRHTWVTQYSSTPGRSMSFIVRDRAREFHPVVGIGSLGSPIVQIRERDAWLGWRPEEFMEFASEEPSAQLAIWLQNTVKAALDELYVEDFLEIKILSRAELKVPNTETITRLVNFGSQQREQHHRLINPKEIKRVPKANVDGNNERHWRQQARTNLFRSKRALALAGMLQARIALNKYCPGSPSEDGVLTLLQSADGRQAIKKILRKAKSDRIGIAMADITVCGAVAPYSPILGGKLVAMLAASPEVISAYHDKYANQESEIASSMAGRPIIRPSKLVYIGTTSLYGSGSSQYNRLRMPASEIGGRTDEMLEYVEIGRSSAYGTSHFSAATVDALVTLVQQAGNGQRVNSIFGEGVSPKLRKIREGLELLNLPTDALLQHGRHRIVYGVPLIRALREFLLGMDDKPEYLFDLSDPSGGTTAIARWWTQRWLCKRISSDEVLENVAGHTLVRPVRHGARVTLPLVEADQGSLFDDLY